MTTRPVDAPRLGTAESRIEQSAAAVESVAGVSSPVIAAAARRVAPQVLDSGIEPAGMEVAAAFLAGIALALDPAHPRYVSAAPQPACPRVGARLLEMPRTEPITHSAGTG